MKHFLKTAPWLAALMLSFACVAEPSSPEEESVILAEELEALSQQAEPAAEKQTASEAAALQPASIMPDHCCVAVFPGGRIDCADFERPRITAERHCSRVADSAGAIAGNAHRGHCRDRSECPQYQPPTPPPPPPPGSCPSNQRCCSFAPDGDCLECVPRSQECR
jgi:hypothetical protein